MQYACELSTHDEVGRHFSDARFVHLLLLDALFGFVTRNFLSADELPCKSF